MLFVLGRSLTLTVPALAGWQLDRRWSTSLIVLSAAIYDGLDEFRRRAAMLGRGPG